MLKNGYLSVNDIIGNQQFQTASGDIQVGTKIIIKKIEIGGLILQMLKLLLFIMKMPLCC